MTGARDPAMQSVVPLCDRHAQDRKIVAADRANLGMGA
jgi:hypothetical protein